MRTIRRGWAAAAGGGFVPAARLCSRRRTGCAEPSTLGERTQPYSSGRQGPPSPAGVAEASPPAACYPLASRADPPDWLWLSQPPGSENRPPDGYVGAG